jgi:hypothetical protein
MATISAHTTTRLVVKTEFLPAVTLSWSTKYSKESLDSTSVKGIYMLRMRKSSAMLLRTPLTNSNYLQLGGIIFNIK